MKGHIDSNTIIVENLDTRLSSLHRAFRQKINKETQTIHDTLDQINLTGIYRACPLKVVGYTFS